MFPSTSHALIVKSMNHFMDKLNLDQKIRSQIQKILNLFDFIKKRETFTFQDKYFSYTGAGDGIAMGWSQSCLLTDICIAAVYDSLWAQEGLFSKNNRVFFASSFRDDGLCLLNNEGDYWSEEKLRSFKSEIFTEISNFSLGNYAVTFESDPGSISFLDLWLKREGSRLNFSIFEKKNQNTTYLNHSSMHQRGIIRNLPKSVMYRLANLTTDFNNTELISKQFPSHFLSLQRAGLVDENFKYSKVESTHKKKKLTGEKYFSPSLMLKITGTRCPIPSSNVT